MRWCIKSADGYLARWDDDFGPTWVQNTIQRRTYANKQDALTALRRFKTACYVLKVSLVRLTTKRERVIQRVIRVMEELLAEPEDYYSVGYRRATKRWLQALKDD